MNVIAYVVAALPEPTLCLPAATALRDVCDANRTALAPHVGAFGKLHAELAGIPVGIALFIFTKSSRAHAKITGYREKQSTAIDCERHPGAATCRSDSPDRGSSWSSFLLCFTHYNKYQAIVSPVVSRLFEALQLSTRVSRRPCYVLYLLI